ncbi:hypothetical protein F4678DRAFT_68922 [Xylaria arbuscula]|nr:hypothetical protein F4678DRAFT_68922 [Xylaria arbuscula]
MACVPRLDSFSYTTSLLGYVLLNLQYILTCPCAAAIEFKIDKATPTALETEYTARCFYKAKFCLESRRSRDVIAWAEKQVTDISHAMLQTIGLPITNLDIQLNIVCLLADRPYALICHDIFVGECDPTVRSHIKSSVSQPIHEVFKKHNTAFMQRNKKFDATIHAEFTRLQRLDKGSRPYFVDTMNPAIYVDGVRTEPGENQDELDESAEESADDEQNH